MSPALIFSFFRTSDLRGKRYAPDFLSGKMDVLQFVLPIVVMTGSEPKPRANAPNIFFMSSDSLQGSVTKCQAAIPG